MAGKKQQPIHPPPESLRPARAIKLRRSRRLQGKAPLSSPSNGTAKSTNERGKTVENSLAALSNEPSVSSPGRLQSHQLDRNDSASRYLATGTHPILDQPHSSFVSIDPHRDALKEPASQNPNQQPPRPHPEQAQSISSLFSHFPPRSVSQHLDSLKPPRPSEVSLGNAPEGSTSQSSDYSLPGSHSKQPQSIISMLSASSQASFNQLPNIFRRPILPRDSVSQTECRRGQNHSPGNNTSHQHQAGRPPSFESRTTASPRIDHHLTIFQPSHKPIGWVSYTFGLSRDAGLNIISMPLMLSPSQILCFVTWCKA
jgi:hypothetical protein